MQTKHYDEKDLRTIQFSGNFDSNEGVFFAQELESIKAKTYDVKYPELTATKAIPVESSAGAGAETIAYYQYDTSGFAKIISNYATDLPRVDLTGKKFTASIKSIGESYGYSLQDVRASIMAGKSLEQRKANAARRANDTLVNKIAYFGDEEHGIVGLFNHPNISTYVLPADGTGASTKFEDKTPDQVLRDLNGMVKSMLELTKNVEVPDTLMLSPSLHAYLNSTPRSSVSDTTILEFFLAKNAYVKNVQIVPECSGAADDGDDIILIYSKNPDKLTLEIPQPFEQLPVQFTGLEYVVPCHSRVGGLIVYYPLSIMKAEGV